MGEFIYLEEREVQARGLNLSAKPQEEKIKKFLLTEEFVRWQKIKELHLSSQLPKQIPQTLFYPGCGSDIFFPLAYIYQLFPKLREINFLFVDLVDALGMIKTMLEEAGISFSQKGNKINFYWYNLLVHLQFVVSNAFIFIDRMPPFQVYFERTFRIMKEQDDFFEQNVYEKLSSGGIIISDSGFQQFPLQKIYLPVNLSVYEEMILGIKET